MNPIAEELNEIIIAGNEHIYEMLSHVGKNLFFPKGILSQGAEAKERPINLTLPSAWQLKKGEPCTSPLLWPC